MNEIARRYRHWRARRRAGSHLNPRATGAVGFFYGGGWGRYGRYGRGGFHGGYHGGGFHGGAGFHSGGGIHSGHR